MLPTLQAYILRDLGKTFLLTVVGLTVVLGLGGGVMNLIELEEVSPSQLLKLLLIVLPVAGTLTLPIAALYSATVTYGRLSADNEFLACRSSGINIHLLFLPSLVISLLSSTGTFYFICFMIPGMVQNLNDFVRGDIRQFVEQRVSSPERLGLPGGRVRIYADGSHPNVNDPNSIILSGVAFVGMGKESWTRYGTGESFIVRFSTENGEPVISGELNNVSYYDRQRGWAVSKYQSISPSRIPLRLRPKVKWLNLVELWRYRSNPGGWPKVGGALKNVRRALVRERYYADVMQELHSGGMVIMSDGWGTITVRAASGTPGAHDGRLSLEDVRVTETRDGVRRTIIGDHAALSVEPSPAEGVQKARLQITGNVRVARDGQGGDPLRGGGSLRGGDPIRKARERLVGIAIPDHIVAQAEAIDDAVFLDRTKPMSLRLATAELRQKAIATCEKFLRDITSEIHSRLAFSVSTFVLVLLGAALGVAFRGAHVLIAFGISFVPSLFVIVMNIMGRQLAEKEGTVGLGLCVIWGAIVLVGLLDTWMMMRVVRR